MKKLLLLGGMLTVCFAVSSCCGNNSSKENADTGAATAEAGTKSCCQGSGIKIITAYKTIKADKVAEYIEFTKDQIEKSRAEEGNISYTLYQDPSDPTKFIFYEEWKDQAAIDFHFSTEHFKNSGSRSAEFDAAPTVLKIYDACEAK